MDTNNLECPLCATPGFAPIDQECHLMEVLQRWQKDAKIHFGDDVWQDYAPPSPAADYLVGAEIEGDYAEFGVYKGTTFSHAMKWLSRLFPQMRFFAIDSFEGLPEPIGIDAKDGYSSHFYKGEFACSQEEFLNNLRNAGGDLSRVVCVKGWFSQTLHDDHPEAKLLKRVAAAWIDCDLYESTMPILNFLTKRLSVGSVIIFDDWRCFRNLPSLGEQRACHEWLTANPQITLRELYSFGFNGQAFSVSSC